MKWIDITGQKINRLTVITYKKIDQKCIWECKCDCGKITFGNVSDIQQGKKKSCGCYRSEISSNKKHGLIKTKFYYIWASMKDRCSNKNLKSFINYGGRGIKICDRWKYFINFKDDMYSDYLEHVKLFGNKNTSLEGKITTVLIVKVIVVGRR